MSAMSLSCQRFNIFQAQTSSRAGDKWCLIAINRPILLSVRQILKKIAGFHTKAPPSPFPLTQIEMTGTFPLRFKHL